MKFVIVTNNPIFRNCIEYPVEYVEGSYLDVLIAVRNKVHSGFTLLSHPLSGSVKPGDTPYKSILVSQKSGKTEEESLSLIEEAMAVCKKLGSENRNRAEKYSEDYSIVDKTLIESAIESAVQVYY